MARASSRLIAARSTSSTRSETMTRSGEFGHSLVGLLIALALLAGLAATVLVSQTGGVKDTGHESGAASTVNASPGNAAADIQAAAAVTCRADYEAVVTAVSEYAALNNRPPIDMAQVAPMMRQPIGSTRYVIGINPVEPGLVEVAAGGRLAAPGDGNCAYAG